MINSYRNEPDESAAVVVPWRRCRICSRSGERQQFNSPKDFSSHLKTVHCRREGGSYLCTYGPNGLCKNLPIEGVSEKDYDTHVSRCHVAAPLADKHISSSQGLVQQYGAMSNQNHSNHQLSGRANNKDTQITPTGSHVSSSNAESDGINIASATTGEGNVIAKSAMESNGARRRSRRWTVYHAKVNMAALLNDPRPGRRQPDFFTKTWGVGFDYLDLSPSAKIPVIEAEHFSDYRKTILPKVAKHQKVLSNPLHVKVPIDAFPVLYTRAHDKASEDLHKVPGIFHSANFDLSEIDIFQQVFPWVDMETSHKSQKLHQEKLSHYLDIIEVQIARQVALKSDAFFRVMSSHEALQTRLSSSTEAILSLRGKMKELSGCLVTDPLTVLVKTRRRQRLQVVMRKLKSMATLHQTQPTVQQLLSSSDYVGALDIIVMAQEVLNKELAGIQSFRHLGSQLNELEKAINVLVRDEFIAFITKDLNKPLTEEVHVIDEDKFTAVYMGLLRQNSIQFIDEYREETTATIKAIVKQTVISYVSASDSCGSDNATVADQMRGLNFNKWLLLMEDIFTNTLIIVNRVKVLTTLMKKLTRQSAGLDGAEGEEPVDPLVIHQTGSQSIITEMLGEKICKELRDLLIRTCETANERCTKVITARSKDMFIEKLSSHEFFSLMSAVERFAKSCDQLCGVKVSTHSVRGCLQGYNIRFINKFHEERKNRLNLLLDNERWRVSDVPKDLQALVTHCELCEQLTSSDHVTGSELSGLSQPYVVVDNQQFVIVGTALALVKMIIEYCACLEDLPHSAPDILTKLTELVKLFNSRSSQLVLGAGALQLAGLKTISAKNLALSQRSLELLLYYLPLIKRQFSIYLIETKTSLLRHIDSVIGEYREHIQIVRGKLRELASAMIDSCVNQWEIRPPMPSLCFRTLCKQVKKFYEATCDVTEPSQLQQLFREVNAMLRGKLKDRLSAVNISLLTGPQQGLIMSDIAYFMENCSSLNSTQTQTCVRLSLSLSDIIAR